MIPKKLRAGDEVRVLVTARSLKIISKETRASAIETLRGFGLNVTFGVHAEEADEFLSLPIEKRIEDLHSAFLNPKVRMVLPVIGGFNSNQLLRYLDYKLIKRNPKIIGGFSDNTVLANAIFAKTGMVTYSSPNFSDFAHSVGADYTLGYFRRCLFESKTFSIEASKRWNDYAWWLGEQPKELPNDGTWMINPGSAKGTIIGGNLCTLNLLQGTEYMPKLGGSIAFIEDDDQSTPVTFDRDLQSLIHQPGFDKVRGIVIGRFQIKSGVTRSLLNKIIKTKKELDGIPIVANVDFGHTYPKITFPIGGVISLEAKDKGINLTVKEH